jgi:hypothetical protein
LEVEVEVVVEVVVVVGAGVDCEGVERCMDFNLAAIAAILASVLEHSISSERDQRSCVQEMALHRSTATYCANCILGSRAFEAVALGGADAVELVVLVLVALLSSFFSLSVLKCNCKTRSNRHGMT